MSDSLSIGPDTQTGHSGKIHVFSRYPGLVTLQALTAGGVDVTSILSQSSFTVGGAQSVEHCASGDNTGLVRRSDTDFLLRKNFTIGIQGIFKTNQYGVGPGAFNSYIAMNKITAGGYAWNWGIPVNGSLRRLGWYNDGPATTLTFAQVFTADVEYRAVLKVEDTTVTLITLSGSETLNRTTPTAGWSGASWKLATMFVGGYQCLFCRQFQLFNGVADSAGIAAFLNNTGNLGSSLYCNLNFDEESGAVAYDSSGNSRDFNVDCSDWGTYVGKVANDGFLRTVTSPVTGQETTISYDTGAIAPGTVITVTAERVRTGFPVRVPAIHKESDTCTIIAAAAPGLAVVGVSLDKQTLSLARGETGILTPTIFPGTATNKTVTWLSSDPSIVSVSALGAYAWQGQGNATITVTTEDGGYTDVCTVTCGAANLIRSTNLTDIKTWLDTEIEKVVPTTGDTRAYFTSINNSNEGSDLTAMKDRTYQISLITVLDSPAAFGAKQAIFQLLIGYQNDVAYEDLTDIQEYFLTNPPLSGVLGIEISQGVISPIQSQDKTVNGLITQVVIDYLSTTRS